MQEEDHIIIDKYLSGELSPQERQAFEARLQTDPDLREELDIRQEMDQFLGQQEQRERLQGQMEELGQKYFTDTQQNTGKVLGLSRRYWLMAASITLFIIAGVLIFNQLQGTLYDQFNDHPRLALMEKGNDALDLSQIETDFNEGQYQEALEGLNRYLTTYPDDLTAQLYKGIAALELHRYEDAEALFTNIHEGNSDLKDYGTWYLALTYLREGDQATCAGMLQQIPEGSQLRAKAEELLVKL